MAFTRNPSQCTLIHPSALMLMVCTRINEAESPSTWSWAGSKLMPNEVMIIKPQMNLTHECTRVDMINAYITNGRDRVPLLDLFCAL